MGWHASEVTRTRIPIIELSQKRLRGRLQLAGSSSQPSLSYRGSTVYMYTGTCIQREDLAYAPSLVNYTTEKFYRSIFNLQLKARFY